jgi:streptogramin lyase
VIGDEGPGSAWKIAANGSYVAGVGGLYNVHSIDVDSAGNVWIGQEIEKRVQEFSSNGTFIRSWNPVGGYPYGLAADASGNLWIGHGWEVRKYSPLGVQLDKFGSYGTGAGHFLGMSRYDGVAVGPEGAVWVVNEPANEVQKWVPTP